VIISETGHLITNAHVVSFGAEEPVIRVTLADGRLFEGTVVGRDVYADIAVVKISDAGPFPVMPLGDASTLNVGDQTIAIGAPLGLPGTVTSGIVSAINRSITVGASQVPGEEDGQFDFDLPGGSTPCRPNHLHPGLSKPMPPSTPETLGGRSLTARETSSASTSPSPQQGDRAREA